MRLSLTIAAGLLMMSAQSFAGVEAHANLESKNDSKVIGSANFKDVTGGLEIEYKILGLKKGQTYGFHIHEKGDCSSKDAKSAGSHAFKIAESGGTSIETPQAFAGDLPALVADDKGTAQGRLTVANLSMEANHPVMGLAIMVHAGPDDVSKHSPARIACGVIKVMKTKK